MNVTTAPPVQHQQTKVPTQVRSTVVTTANDAQAPDSVRKVIKGLGVSTNVPQSSLFLELLDVTRKSLIIHTLKFVILISYLRTL